jgi:hypothetical protein
MTPDEIAEVLAEALDRHKERALVAYKVDRGEWSDGTPWLYVDIPGGDKFRIAVEEG